MTVICASRGLLSLKEARGSSHMIYLVESKDQALDAFSMRGIQTGGQIPSISRKAFRQAFTF
jgi:hypothetical protein